MSKFAKATIVTVLFLFLILCLSEIIGRGYFRTGVRSIAIPFANDQQLNSIPGFYQPNFSCEKIVHDARLPYSIHINRFGFRGRQPTNVQKEKDTFRIVCIGDSVTFGYHLQERQTFPVLLQKLLHEKGKKNIEVINAGLGGSTIHDFLYQYDKKLGALQSDLVILTFCTNDIHDMSRAVPLSERIEIMSFGKRHGFFKGTQNVQQAIFRSLHQQKKRVGIKMRKDTPLIKEQLRQNRPLVAKYFRSKFGSDTLILPNTKKEQVFKLWDKYESDLILLSKKLFQEGGRLIVNYFPEYPQCVLPVEKDAPQQVLGSICKKNGLAFLEDTLNAFLKYADPKVLYLVPKDFHPSAKGALLMAQQVAGWVNENVLSKKAVGETVEKIE